MTKVRVVILIILGAFLSHPEVEMVSLGVGCSVYRPGYIYYSLRPLAELIQKQSVVQPGNIFSLCICKVRRSCWIYALVA